jgi:hypothetical protein
MILPEDPQERKNLPMWRACLMFFPKTFVAITKLSMKGQKQHKYNEGDIHWDRSKSKDDWDSLIRHMFNLQEAIKNKDVAGIREHAPAISWRGNAISEKALDLADEYES